MYTSHLNYLANLKLDLHLNFRQESYFGAELDKLTVRHGSREITGVKSTVVRGSKIDTVKAGRVRKIFVDAHPALINA